MRPPAGSGDECRAVVNSKAVLPSVKLGLPTLVNYAPASIVGFRRPWGRQG